MKRKKGFTLVEMLIVVVIIGILASALFPKITGYMERTRDLKRQTDLRNIAVALEMYRDHYGEFPLRKGDHRMNYDDLFWGASSILGISPEYLTQIPKDPKKSTMIKIHNSPYEGGLWTEVWRGKNWSGGFVLRPGDYLYQLVQNKGSKCWGAVLVAKAETAENANYVLDLKKGSNYKIGGAWRNPKNIGATYTCSDMDLTKIHLCNQVEKSTNGTVIAATETNENCTYTSADQLYYVYKIE